MLAWVERTTINIDLDSLQSRIVPDVPDEALANGRQLLNAVLKEIPSTALVLADLVRMRTANRFQAEAQALANLVGVSWRAILLANISYDLVLTQIGCSTVALPTPNGPVLARNMDWWPEGVLAQASYQIRCFRQQQLRFINAGWPGAMGVVTGLSQRGFAVALNAVSGKEKPRKTGYPVLLHLRRVLEDAANFRDALRMLSEQTLAVSALFTLVGTQNDERVAIERTPTRHALRWPEHGRPLVTTNDYRLLDQPQADPRFQVAETTCRRFDALTEFFHKHQASQEVDDNALLYVLSDPSVIQEITCQHIILRPGQRTVRMFVPRRLVATDEG